MKKVLVYFHTHWDREWYKTRVEFNFRLVKVFDDVLEKLKKGDLPCFYFDGQIIALKDYLTFRPENEELIRDFISKNKLFIGPFYCSTDSFLVSAQSYISNIDLGIKYAKSFGCEKFLGYCADTFGHSKCLSEIFKFYNFDAGLFWRGLGNLPICFNWNGLKSIYLRQGYFHDYLNSEYSYEKKAELIKAQLDKINDGIQKILFMPLGADHLKVADNLKTQLFEINKFLKDYELIFSNPFEYVKKVSPTISYESELRDNSRNFILSGVFSSRIDLKQKNAYSQWNLLRIAEPLNALCYALNLTKQNFQPHIDIAKEELIKNHAHDSIYGCSIDNVHKDMSHRFSIADQTSKTVIDEIINELSSDTDKINIINLSDYNFSGLCELKTYKKLNIGQLIKTNYAVEKNLWLDENKTPVTEDFKNIYTYLIKVKNVKPFSLEKVKTDNNSDLKITNNSIENSSIALKIKNGKFELFNKKNPEKIYKNFIEIVDVADVGDSYNFSPIKNDKKIKAKIVSSKILVKGDLQSVLNVELKIFIPEMSFNKARSKKIISHKINMEIILDAESDYIKFKLNWKNKSKNHILKAVFNFEEPVSKTVSDDMFGFNERYFDVENDISKNIPVKKGIELKSNVSPMQTFVETQGVGFITKGLNEYDVYKKTLSITLLRSTGIISNPKNPTRGTPAGPPIEVNDLFSLGKNEAQFAITFNKSLEEIQALQQAYYGCVLAFNSEVDEKILFKKRGNLLVATYDSELKVKIWDGKKIEIA